MTTSSSPLAVLLLPPLHTLGITDPVIDEEGRILLLDQHENVLEFGLSAAQQPVAVVTLGELPDTALEALMERICASVRVSATIVSYRSQQRALVLQRWLPLPLAAETLQAELGILLADLAAWREWIDDWRGGFPAYLK